MAHDARIGTFDDLVAGAEPALAAIARRLRSLVIDLDPGAVEVVRLGDGAATFGVGPKQMSEGYVYIAPHRAHVNLGFYRGAALPDPEDLLEGTGKALRHVKIRSLDDVDRPPVPALVAAAVAERRAAFG
jgi:hypothetical protein